MKRAIISGSTGLIGIAVSKYFAFQGVETLCLGRQPLSQEDCIRKFGKELTYLNVEMEDIASLAERTDLIAWASASDCVFFNFAWSGCQKLTDGSFSDQLDNAVFAAEAVKAAKRLGCIKFVNVGTLEETFAEGFLSGKKDYPYYSDQTNYVIAKLAARDMCKMVSYLEKIDYVHTRLSVPLDPDLLRGNYVAATLKKIAKNMPFDAPMNKQLFDIVFLDDVARAYYMIGIKGKNKADYFIGTSKPATLSQVFLRFEHIVKNQSFNEADLLASIDTDIFSTAAINQDTGFSASTRLQDIFEKMKTH
jgi:nucleoside-diphosphate-sugar epimerase